MSSEDFYRSLTPFDRFEGVVSPENYRPLPDDWFLAVTDIVGSRQAIERGGYRTVNFIGAAPIAAVGNALGDHHLPYIFGGDGCLICVPPGKEDQATKALAATAAWARRSFDMTLRVGLLPVRDIRAAGRDVRVARFRASPGITYAMFDGGGCHWAEDALKGGRLDPIAGPEDAAPDLEGLSCRWQPLESLRGVVLSLIVEPEPDARTDELASFIDDLTARISAMAGDSRLIPDRGPRFTWPPPRRSVEHEARASAAPGEEGRARRRIYLVTAIARMLEILGITLGGFSARRYRYTTGRNADFRKYQDGLKATIDCTPGEVEALTASLETARQAGLINYGLSRQSAALMTCIVPSPLTDDHAHFVDGAEGGYAAAATDLAERGRSSS